MSYIPGINLTARRLPAVLGNAGTYSIFTITGFILITHLSGHVTGALDATGCNLKLSHSLGPTDICSVLAVASTIQDVMWTISGVFAAALVATLPTAVVAAGGALMAGVSASAGTIRYVTTGNQTGIVEWLIGYIALTPNALVVPA